MDIDLSVKPGDWAPAREYANIRENGPVFWSDAMGGWIVSSYADVKTVLVNRNMFTSEGTPIADAFGAEAMLTEDSGLHNRMRAIWAEALSLPGILARQREIQRVAEALLAKTRARLQAGETVDLIPVFLDFTTDIIMWMMDFPRARTADMQRWNNASVNAPALKKDKESKEYHEHLAAKAETVAFLAEQMADRRARLEKGERPGDLVSMMVTAIGRDGITEKNAADNLMNLALGALDTTTKWLGNVVVLLKRHPSALAEIRADKALLAPAVEEVLRVETVAQMLLRRVRQDTEFGGQNLKANDTVYILPGVANHDAAMFEHAGVFDIHREPKPHLGFGFGMHQCLGANVARQEVLVFSELLLDLLPEIEITACDYAASWAVWGPMRLNVRI